MSTTENTTEITVQEKIFTVEDLRKAEKSRLEAIVSTAKSLDITITSKEEYEKVHAERMKLQKCRTGIANARKAFTEPLEKQKKEAMAIADELIAITEPTEKALIAREEAYEAEQARIKAEKEAEENRILQERVDELNSYGAAYVVEIVKKMSNEGFRAMADNLKRQYEEALAEKKRIEEEAEKKRQEEAEKNRLAQQAIDAEREKLAKEKAEFDKKQREAQEKEDARVREEQAKKQAEEAQKKAEELQKRNQKYTAFLSENGYTEETKDSYIVRNDGTKVLLFKLVATTEL